MILECGAFSSKSIVVTSNTTSGGRVLYYLYRNYNITNFKNQSKLNYCVSLKALIEIWRTKNYFHYLALLNHGCPLISPTDDLAAAGHNWLMSVSVYTDNYLPPTTDDSRWYSTLVSRLHLFFNHTFPHTFLSYCTLVSCTH